MRPLRVVVIGCGRMGSLRATAAIRFGATVTAAVDARSEVADRLAEQLPGCRAAAGVSAIDLDGVDALFVCTPPGARGGVEVEAALRGVSVFMEKPIGLSAAQAAPLTAALSESRAISAVGYMNRYRQSVRSARADLQNHTVLGASGFWVNAPYGVSWWADPLQSGGAINEQATHMVDLARYLLGEVIRVRAVDSAAERDGGVDRSVSLILELETGAAASLFYSCGAKDKRIGFEVFTPAGSVLLDGWDLQRLDPLTRQPLCPPAADRYDIFHDETAAFLRAVESGSAAEVLCDFEEAVRTQRVMDAIEGAMRTGETREVEAGR